jgi:hypothetical protein
MTAVWIAAAAVAVAIVAAALRRRRARTLDRMRAAWGKPVERVRRLDAMAASHAARIERSPGSRSLDPRTWADLDMDDVFHAIDRTVSTLGQHALYHRLRTAPAAEHLEAFEALVGRMTADPAARERAQVALARLADPHGYDIWWLTDTNALDRRPVDAAFPVLTILSLTLAALALVSSAAVLPLVVIVAVNVAVRYLTDRRVGALARGFRQCAPVIATAESLRCLAGPAVAPLVGPLANDVAVLGRMKLISRWTNGDPFMLSIDAHPLAVLASDVVAAAYEYLNLAFLLDATGVYVAVRDLARHGGSLGRAAAAAGEVDAAIAIASFRAGRTDWTVPRFRGPADPTELTDLKHPLVDGAVPNSIALRAGSGVLVTGSNMSGKSTFLRTVGVNAILAQTIHTCLAREYSAPVFEVRSCIGRADDLLTGRSYYIAEVEALVGLVRASRDAAPRLFLLDELFRGTNAVERIAAGHAVLESLLDASGTRKPHIVIAATHDRELVDLTSDLFDPYHFGDEVGADGLRFDHRLQRGPSTTRNALALLRLHGAPDTLLSTAAATAELLDRQRGRSLIPR